MKISNIKSTLPSFRYQKTCITKTLERYFKLQLIIFILKRHFQNCPLLNFICYNTSNDIRHLCDIEFKNQIQNRKTLFWITRYDIFFLIPGEQWAALYTWFSILEIFATVDIWSSAVFIFLKSIVLGGIIIQGQTI